MDRETGCKTLPERVGANARTSWTAKLRQGASFSSQSPPDKEFEMDTPRFPSWPEAVMLHKEAGYISADGSSR
jgi:hypothetical protein